MSYFACVPKMRQMQRAKSVALLHLDGLIEEFKLVAAQQHAHVAAHGGAEALVPGDGTVLKLRFGGGDILHAHANLIRLGMTSEAEFISVINPARLIAKRK